MKMTELRAENEELKKQITLLSEQKDEKASAEITQLKEKLRSSKKSIKDLNAEKKHLSDKILALENGLASREQDNQILKADIEHIQLQLAELSGAHAKTLTEVESLREDRQALQKKAAQLKTTQAELDRLRGVESICNEKTAQVESLQAELVQQGQHLIQARAEAARQAAEYQEHNEKISTEMELVRNRLQAELEVCQEQSGAEITSLQAQKDGLSTKVTELSEKLKLVAVHLERQLGEKRKIASQYNTTVNEYQNYKVNTKNQIDDLMGLLQKMATDLDASRASHPTQENQAGTVSKDKPLIQADPAAADRQHQQQLLDLRNQLSELNDINAQQNRELNALSARMKRINQVLATPRGRVLAQLLGLKK